MLPKVGDPCPIEPGTTGTVTKVTGPYTFGPRPTHQVSVDWDAPRSLSLCIPPDEIRVLSQDSEKGESR